MEIVISPAWFHQLDSDSFNSGLVEGMCSTECHSSLFSFGAACGLCLAWYQTELSTCGTVSIFSSVVCAWGVNKLQWAETKKQTSLLYCQENKIKVFFFFYMIKMWIQIHALLFCCPRHYYARLSILPIRPFLPSLSHFTLHPTLSPLSPQPLSLPPPAFLWRLISHSIISQSPCRHKLTDGTTLIDYPLDSNELSHQA